MATIKTGLVDTEDILSNERVVDMEPRIKQLQPDEQQFRVWLSQIAKKQATREIVEWLEGEYVPRVSALAEPAATAATAATAIWTVTTGDGNTLFRADDVVRVMTTGEALLVTATSANSIAVTRGWGDVAAATAASTSKLMIVGSAASQGASSASPRVVQRVRAYNYIQEQRDPVWFTDVMSAINLYSGREPAIELAIKAVEHGRAIENTLFFGARDFNTSASPGPKGSSGGAIEFISTHVDTTAASVLTPAEFDTFLEGPYAYGSKNKAFFCAPRVATVLSQMLRDVWQPATVGERKFGAKVDAYISGTYGWTIPVMVKREWQDLGVASNTDYGTYGFLIDMDYVSMVNLQDIGGTKLRRNIEEPSSTAVAHEYYTAFSIRFAQEKAHGLIKGIRGYAAS